MSLPSVVYKSLEKLVGLEALSDSGFQTVLDNMAYSRNCEVDWP